MPRPEEGVAADLNRLGCHMNQKALAALAQQLLADEAILDALGTDSDGSTHALVLTRARILGVTFNPRSWLGEAEYIDVTQLPWRDVVEVYAGDQYGDRKTCIISVSGYSRSDSIELSFQRGRIDEQHRDRLVQRIQEMAARVKPTSTPTAG